MLKIAYDLRLARGVGGISSYTRGLINYICQNISPEDCKLFLCYNSFKGNFPSLPEHIKERCHSVFTRFPLFFFPGIGLEHYFRYRLIYSYLCQKHDIDIFHGTMMLNVINPNVVSISTVPDLFFALRQDLARDRYSTLMRNKLKELNKCDAIIAMSETTKNDLIKFNISAEKIRVIYIGLDDIFLNFPNTGEDMKMGYYQKINKKYNLPHRYFLYVGNFVSRKNTPVLIDIFYKYKKRKKYDIKLVLVGPFYGSDYLKVRRRVSNLGMDNDVNFIGCVDQEELVYIYAKAEALIFLSLYEGFGIPPLEAMAVGTPTIVADNSSMKELYQGYTYLVNPEYTDEVLDAMDRVLSDQGFKKEIVDKAMEYAKRFSWDKIAKKTLETYCKTVKKHN